MGEEQVPLLREIEAMRSLPLSMRRFTSTTWTEFDESGAG
jgi:hypothetical protein